MRRIRSLPYLAYDCEMGFTKVVLGVYKEINWAKMKL